MRGFDYRSSDYMGIALLLCCALESSRAVKQALGRVGRYGDPGARHMLAELDGLVDQVTAERLASDLLFRAPGHGPVAGNSQEPELWEEESKE